MKKMYAMINNKKGFTLIELIVVIAILGILAAVAVPRISGFQEKAKTSADLSTYQTIDKAIAIGVANENFKYIDATKNTITVTTDAAGAVTFAGTAGAYTGATNTSIPTEMAKLIDATPVFKKSTHLGQTFTWTLGADGSITKSGFVQ